MCPVSFLSLRSCTDRIGGKIFEEILWGSRRKPQGLLSYFEDFQHGSPLNFPKRFVQEPIGTASRFFTRCIFSYNSISLLFFQEKAFIIVDRWPNGPIEYGSGQVCAAGRREPCQAGNRAALSGCSRAMQVACPFSYLIGLLFFYKIKINV